MKTQAPLHTDSVLVTDTPDVIVALDSDYFFCSSPSAAKPDSEETDDATRRLTFLAETVFPDWFANRYSLHQFSAFAAQFGIELWTAPQDMVARTADVTSGLAPFAFFIRFTREWKGDVLVQCEIYRQDKVH